VSWAIRLTFVRLYDTTIRLCDTTEVKKNSKSNGPESETGKESNRAKLLFYDTFDRWTFSTELTLHCNLLSLTCRQYVATAINIKRYNNIWHYSKQSHFTENRWLSKSILVLFFIIIIIFLFLSDAVKQNLVIFKHTLIIFQIAKH